MSSPSAGLAVVLLGMLAVPLSAQERPDTLAADSVQIADSVQAADSVQVLDSVQVADSAVVADTARVGAGPGEVGAPADTLPADSLVSDTIFYNLPEAPRRIPSGFATGIWTWDRDDIMASGANTLAELFQTLPGVVPLLGGDYGTPQSMSAFGQGGGGYRIVRDGFELYPLQGGVVDLQLVGLAGVESVRLDRSMGRMVVEIRSHRYDDGRPFSVVEAGTGDLDTNMFRGVYADPTALFGSVALGLERIDTRGRRGMTEEGGNRTGGWVRYQLHWKERAGLAVDYRQGGSQTKVDVYAPSNERRDLMLRASWRPLDGVVLQGLTGRSTLEADPTEAEGFNRIGGTRSQHGGRIGIDVGPLWTRGVFRTFEGELPARRIEVEGGFVSPRWGGVSGRYETADFDGVGTSHLAGRAWLTPLRSATIFAAYGTGEQGARAGPVADGPPRPPLLDTGEGQPGTAAITDRRTLRLGAAASRGGATLAAAALHVDGEPALPLGIELDEGAEPVSTAARRGVEAMAEIPLPLIEGLSLRGSYQWWEEEGPYLPKQIYRGSFDLHRVYLPTGNLEVWGSLGVRGHDPMLVFVADDGEGGPGLARVPFYQSWYAYIQVRVVTVRLWIGMDNMTLRRNLQLFPDRLLPFGRSFFALRWDMWN